jgi:hypothetical protein
MLKNFSNGPLGGARAQQITSLSQIWANRNNQVGMANAVRDVQNMSAFRQYQYNYRNMMAARAKENNDIRVAGRQQIAEQKAGAIGAEFDITGRALSGSGPIGSGAGLPMQHFGNIYNWQMRGDALVEATRGRNQNLENYYNDMNKSAGAYATDMYAANADFAKAQAAVANDSASQASKGVNDGYMRQLHTANRVYDLETEANQARFDAQMKAADITLRSGLEAANLRALSHVISQVAGKVARDIEKGIEMRF